MTVTEKSVGHDSRPLSPPHTQGEPHASLGGDRGIPLPVPCRQHQPLANDHSCPPHTPREDDCPRWGYFD